MWECQTPEAGTGCLCREVFPGPSGCAYFLNPKPQGSGVSGGLEREPKPNTLPAFPKFSSAPLLDSVLFKKPTDGKSRDSGDTGEGLEFIPATSLNRYLLSIYYVPGTGETVVNRESLCSHGGIDSRKQEALCGGLCVFLPGLVVSSCAWSRP